MQTTPIKKTDETLYFSEGIKKYGVSKIGIIEFRNEDKEIEAVHFTKMGLHLYFKNGDSVTIWNHESFE